jgi:hypothetical protein
VRNCTAGPTRTSSDVARVDEDRAEVDEHARAEVDVAAVIALNRRHDVALVTERAEQLEQQRSASGDVFDRRRVDGAHDPLGTNVLGPHLRV